MNKVLVTGATGFIGRSCLAPLEALGYEVHAVSRHRGECPARVAWHEADLLDDSQAAALLADLRPSHLLHLGWYAEHGRYWTSPENLRWVQASLNLLMLFKSHGGERFVGVGTCAEYDWKEGLCSESSTPLSPTSLYGVAKHSLQMLLTAYSREAHLSAAWARVFFLYGPGEHPDRLVSSVARSLLSGQAANTTSGEQRRDYLYVDDVGSALAAVLDSEVQGSINVGSGTSISVADLVRTVAAALGREGDLALGAIPGTPDVAPIVVADVKRLAGEVGWTPRWSLRDGVTQTVEWWRQQVAKTAVP